LRKGPFQPRIDGKLPFPWPEIEGGSTITAEDRPEQGLGIVPKEMGRITILRRINRETRLCGFSKDIPDILLRRLFRKKIATCIWIIEKKTYERSGE
jgi:hypothetical protein